MFQGLLNLSGDILDSDGVSREIDSLKSQTEDHREKQALDAFGISLARLMQSGFSVILINGAFKIVKKENKDE